METKPMNLHDRLNAAGEALKATGEPVIILSFFQAGDYGREADGFAVRVESPGTSGCHGSGKTPAEAYQAAMNQREIDAARAEIEAQIRAEVDERMAALGRQEAA
jgi:hypothetical protein